jgi:hypothetical protein
MDLLAQKFVQQKQVYLRSTTATKQELHGRFDFHVLHLAGSLAMSSNGMADEAAEGMKQRVIASRWHSVDTTRSK